MVATMKTKKETNTIKNEAKKEETLEIYNSEFKHKYLNDMVESKNISEYSAKAYFRIFDKTKNHEYELNKDLYEFTVEDIEKVLFGFDAKNRNTLETYGRIMSAYFNWCKEKQYISDNPLKAFKPTSFEKYLTNSEEYFLEKELRRFEDGCENYQDAVILRLLFVGVGGKQMSEIRNLKKSDIDYTNNILNLTNTLTSDKQGNPTKVLTRTHKVDDYTIKLIDGAISQKTYLKRNGNLNQTDENNVRPYTDLVDNDYVVRPSITKTDNWNNPVEKAVIYRRIQIVAKYYGIEDMNAKLIQRSGMIYHASKLLEKTQEEIDSSDLIMISKEFGIGSHHNLKGFITMENIARTYPEVLHKK